MTCPYLAGCHPHHGAGFTTNLHPAGHVVYHHGAIITAGHSTAGALVLFALGVTILWHRYVDGEWG
jgi:hypothetical protein